jgi:histidinol dehydrogenase
LDIIGMMKIVSWQNLDAAQQKEVLARPPHKDDTKLVSGVTEIVRQVRDRGDAALREYSERFDKSKLADFRVSDIDIKNGAAKTDSRLRQAMEQAATNIMAFHQAQRPQSVKVDTMAGVSCELHWRAIDTVGFYIPGGTAPLFSTVFMQAIPAMLAGCRRQILCTPPQHDGKVHPAVLAAAHLCGLSEIYAVGGAHAIAAMAYGTATIPKVDKISGPGNAYVTLAKQMVACDPRGAAIDMPAGPSEVMVIAEASARPSWVAADLLAQAEHDPDAQAILVTTSEDLANKVLDEIKRQLAKLSRKDIAEKSLSEGRIIIVLNTKIAIRVANLYAPEHLILHSDDAARWLPEIRHAGSVFLGPLTPESAGDYASGTNHVLPTYGYARAYNGITTLTYMKSMTVQTMTREGLQKLGSAIETLARGEGLDAHANAVTVRLEDR